jgi:DNA (cytosine-5)-methyltransferase 1
MRDLILSLFPGIDLLGRGFEEEGYCVVRGPDLVWGGDIHRFHPPVNRFEGLISGTPCQDFSRLRRSPPTGLGSEMLREFSRCVINAQPDWWLIENVPTIPSITIPGYRVQRFDLRASECGLTQARLRHFQFGSRHNTVLILDRAERQAETTPACTASEGQRGRGRRDWQDFCALMGLPPDFDLPGLSVAARYRAVGNGVPVPVARFIARAIRDHQHPADLVRLCVCGCGRRVFGRQRAALPACRKRMERRRNRDTPQ